MTTRWEPNRFLADRLPDGWERADEDPLEFHRTLPGYEPTPLVELPDLARELGVARLAIKDESKRFGLNAFKVLGASYAVHRFMRGRKVTITLSTATDGNHGRAVAWAARRLGQKAVIYVPSNTAPARIDAIRGEGADVVVVEGTYDETVKRAAASAGSRARARCTSAARGRRRRSSPSSRPTPTASPSRSPRPTDRSARRAASRTRSWPA